jgi:MOSC domain-containing protein
MPSIESIWRYPIKGLTPERLNAVTLTPDRCLPYDRRFALARADTEFDPARPEWLPKTKFVMLMREARLAALRSRFDSASERLVIEHKGSAVFDARLDGPDSRAALGRFIGTFLGLGSPPRLVEAAGHSFADAQRKPNATTGQYVSLINLASLAALEAAMEATLDPLRFRANIYLNGVPAWAEMDWIESQIAIGQARLRVLAPITRCAATEVNPATGVRDQATLGGLERAFGHTILGIYGEVVEGGDIREGDTLAVG